MITTAKQPAESELAYVKILHPDGESFFSNGYKGTFDGVTVICTTHGTFHNGVWIANELVKCEEITSREYWENTTKRRRTAVKRGGDRA